MTFVQPFSPLSSEVDWCEPNYIVSKYIAEFVNTVSNLPLTVFPMIQYYFFVSYAHYCQLHLRLLLLTIAFVGFGSTYFHATLSFAGQLVDECGILWTLSLVSAGYWPFHLLPFGFQSRSKFTLMYTVMTFCCTVLSIGAPWFNQFALIIFGAPFVITVLVEHYIYREEHQKIYLVTFPRFISGFALAFFVWTLDKAFCPLWTALCFPYLHGVWHVLIAYSATYAMVLCTLEDLVKTNPSLIGVDLRYFPEWAGKYGVPYVSLDPQYEKDFGAINRNSQTKLK